MLTLTLDGCDWSTSSPASFTPRERAPYIYWIASRLGGSQILSGRGGEETNLCHYRKSNTGRPRHYCYNGVRLGLCVSVKLRPLTGPLFSFQMIMSEYEAVVE
jgi:hypothetical protein